MGQGDFLEGLNLTDEERRQLRAIGVSSPLALAHMIKASRDAFRKMIGERADEVERSLLASLSPDERATLDEPLPPRFSLGASLGRPPRVTQRPTDLKRNRLHDEIRRLRASPDQSAATRERILALEKELDALLDRGPLQS